MVNSCGRRPVSITLAQGVVYDGRKFLRAHNKIVVVREVAHAPTAWMDESFTLSTLRKKRKDVRFLNCNRDCSIVQAVSEHFPFFSGT